MVDGIEDRVIRAAAVLASEADVERRDAEVLQERRVVRAGAQGGQAQRGALARLLRVVRGARDLLPRPQPVPHAGLRLWVPDRLRDFVQERLQGHGAARVEEATRVGVGVHVGDGLGPQLVGVGLRPFRGPEQPRLLARPRGRTRWCAAAARPLSRARPRRAPPRGARPRRSRDRAAPFTQASWWLPRSTHSSGRSEPFITAITFSAGASFQSNSSFRRTRAGPGPKWYVIGSAPRHASGTTLPSRAPQQRLRVGVGDGHHRDLRQRRRVLALEALRVLRGRHARSQRIAGKERHVRDRAPLRARAPCATGPSGRRRPGSSRRRAGPSRRGSRCAPCSAATLGLIPRHEPP